MLDKLSGDLTLDKAISVTNALTLTKGLLYTTSTNILTLDNATAGAGVTISGASEASFVHGPMIQVVRSGASSNTYSRSFPIGKDSDYRPVTLSITTSGANNPGINYTAEVINISAAALGYTLPTGVNRVSDVRYWDISQSSTTNFTNARVTLTYGANDGVADPNGLVIVKTLGNGTSWINVGGSGTAAGSGTITSNSFTSFSKFTLGNITTNPLPVELIYFEALNRENHVDINWATAWEINNDYFTVERSVDGENFETVVLVKGNGNTTKRINYTAKDENPLSGVSYYRLKQTDFNGTFEYSPVRTVRRRSALADAIIFPNPNNGNFTFTMSVEATQEVTLRVINNTGRVVYVEKLLAHPSKLEKQINLSHLPNGIYSLVVNSGENMESYKFNIIR